MDEVYMCELCLQVYEPEEINGVRILKEFKGYTIDLRLHEFRKVFSGGCMEFIDFSLPEGKNLLAQMHEEATR